MQQVSLNTKSVLIPAALLEHDYKTIAICCKALYLLSRIRSVSYNKLIGKLAEDEMIPEEEVENCLLLGLNLERRLTNVVVKVQPPTPKILKTKEPSAIPSGRIDDEEFLSLLERSYPDLNVRSLIPEFIQTYRSKGYAITQKSLSNYIARIKSEKNLMQPKPACPFCKGTGKVATYQLGEEVVGDCPCRS